MGCGGFWRSLDGMDGMCSFRLKFRMNVLGTKGLIDGVVRQSLPAGELWWLGLMSICTYRFLGVVSYVSRWLRTWAIFE